MRKFFCSISVFLFLCLLSFGYYTSYERLIAKKEENRPFTEVTDTNPVSNNPAARGEYGIFFLKEEDGYVMVYERDQTTLYEPTLIPIDSLPEPLKSEISAGKYVKTLRELYSFLENYST